MPFSWLGSDRALHLYALVHLDLTMPAAPLVQASTARTPSPPQPVRKVINCIVDDTALIAGAKKSTRDGLRKWVAHGAVRLFVPLYSTRAFVRMASLTAGSARPA